MPTNKLKNPTVPCSYRSGSRPSAQHLQYVSKTWKETTWKSCKKVARSRTHANETRTTQW